MIWLIIILAIWVIGIPVAYFGRLKSGKVRVRLKRSISALFGP